MRFSVNLLKQFVSVPGELAKLCERMTERSLEIESVAPVGPDFSNIFAAQVTSVEKHPNADRLRVVHLDMGKPVGPVVCGAFNFEVGDVVALALPGAVIAKNIHSTTHESFTLAKATIRGVESQGMICAAFELGLTENAGDKPEILLLEKTVPPGTPLQDVCKPFDHCLYAALPANRPDLHSHIGFAREIAAVLGKKIIEAKTQTIKYKPSSSWKVKIEDSDFCPRYYGARINVTIGPSPDFIQKTLIACNIRPLNNVVDITNFVMLELGEPTHAYDAKKIAGNITVRRAKKSETFQAINHKTYELSENDYVIADEKKAVALAGIMGGVESEIGTDTTAIILEAANFNQKNIRRTSQRLGIKTDGSVMWERGIHPHTATLGYHRALQLLKQYANAQILEHIEYKKQTPKPKTFSCSTESVNKLLGSDLSSFEIKKILSRFGIAATGTKTMRITPPWWRSDILSPADAAEEVLKLHGYNTIKPQPLLLQPFEEKHGSEKKMTTAHLHAIKQLWARLGYTEVQNYNFISGKDIEKFGDERAHLEIANPLSEDQQYVKRHLLIPMLKNTALNQKKFGDFRIFEIGKQYLGYEKEPIILTALYFSKTETAERLLMSVKGSVSEFFRTFGCTDIAYGTRQKTWLEITIGKDVLGITGYVDKAILRRFDIDGTVVFAKLSLEKIWDHKRDILYEEPGKFQKAERDISIVVNADVPWKHVESSIQDAVSDTNRDNNEAMLNSKFGLTILLADAPFLSGDLNKKFHNELAQKGKKNFLIHLIFKPKNNTLSDGEITGIMNEIMVKLQRDVHAEIR